MGSTQYGRIQGRDFGVKTSPSTEIFFNLLGLFEKKIPKHPKFCRPYKKFLKHNPQKIRGYTPAIQRTVSFPGHGDLRLQ